MKAWIKKKIDFFLSVLFDRSAWLKQRWAESLPTRQGGLPFVAVPQLSQATVALFTTGGFHHREDHPFDMSDTKGDPSYREIDLSLPNSAFLITHDYYDHRDAEADRNVVFPIERTKQLVQEGILGVLYPRAFSFMGHLFDETHIPAMEENARTIAKTLKREGVGVAVLTPA